MIKPFPAGRFETLHGGLGVMADDAMAAVYAEPRRCALLMWLASRMVRMTGHCRFATAEIIAVGSELLGSTRLDTNSLFLAERLAALGIALRAKTVVGDDASDLRDVLSGRRSSAPIWSILTGGLGPTDDDLTRDVVAEVLGCRWTRTRRSSPASQRASRGAACGCRRSTAGRRWCRAARPCSTTRTAPRPGLLISTVGGRASCCCCPARRAR